MTAEMDRTIEEVTSAPKMNQERRIAVIVPVYNALDWTLRCIEALRTIDAGEPFDLYVVDDASPSSSVWPKLEELHAKLGNFVLERNRENLGFLGSCNQFFERVRAQYDFVFLCNSDVIVTKNWLVEGMNLFRTYQNCALVSYFATRGAQLTLYLPEGVTVAEANDFLRHHRHTKRCNAVTSVGHLLGIRITSIGANECLFDPVFGKGYGEESDLHYRLLSRGHETLVVPTAMVYHRGETSFGMVSEKPQTQIFHERWGLLHEKALAAEKSNDSLSWLRDIKTCSVGSEMGMRMQEYARRAWEQFSKSSSSAVVFVSTATLYDFLDDVCAALLDLQKTHSDVVVLADADNDLTRRLPARQFFLRTGGWDLLELYLKSRDGRSIEFFIDSEVSTSVSSEFFSRVKCGFAEPRLLIAKASLGTTDKSARIIVLAPDYTLSGGIFVIRDFIQAMETDGYDVTIATPSGSLNHANAKYGGRLCSIAYAIKNYGAPFDLFVFTWWESLFWGARIPARRFLWLAQSIEEYFPPAAQPQERLRALAPYLLRGIEVVAVSHWIQAVLSTRFGTDSHLIMNQLPGDIEWAAMANSRDWKSKLSPQDCSVVVEGSFAKYKNLPEAINLCDRLNFKSKTLVFAGTPESWEFIDELRAKGWVVLNNISRAEVVRVFSVNDVLIRASLLDSFGFAPLEMMATGGLVIVKHYQGAPGLCIHGRNAICFSNETDILNAFETQHQTAGDYFGNLSEEARNFSQQFLNSAIPKYQGLARMLLKQPFDATRNAALQALCEAVTLGIEKDPRLNETFAYMHQLRHSQPSELLVSSQEKPLRYRLADFVVLRGVKRFVPIGLYHSIKRKLGA